MPDIIKTGAIKKILIIFLLVTLSGCGFHLRKDDAGALPEELKLVRLKIEVSKHGALLNNLFIDEWQRAGGAISESTNIPELTIERESVLRRVLSVSPADAKVSEYSLKYVLSFQFTAPSNKKPLINQKIHLQRQYTVDTINILAKEHEQAWLTDAMRKQAIQQVVRKISHLNPELLNKSELDQNGVGVKK